MGRGGERDKPPHSPGSGGDLPKPCSNSATEGNQGSEPIPVGVPSFPSQFQNSWQPVILTYSQLSLPLKNRPCQLQQIAFKNILLDYTALPSKFLTMPVSVPHSIKKGVAYLIFFSLAAPCYKYLRLGRRAANTGCMKSPRG